MEPRNHKQVVQANFGVGAAMRVIVKIDAHLRDPIGDHRDEPSSRLEHAQGFFHQRLRIVQVLQQGLVKNDIKRLVRKWQRVTPRTAGMYVQVCAALQSRWTLIHSRDFQTQSRKCAQKIPAAKSDIQKPLPSLQAEPTNQMGRQLIRIPCHRPRGSVVNNRNVVLFHSVAGSTNSIRFPSGSRQKATRASPS